MWHACVNRNGVVRYESVMALRTKLDELGKMEGIAHAEKGGSQQMQLYTYMYMYILYMYIVRLCITCA